MKVSKKFFAVLICFSISFSQYAYCDFLGNISTKICNAIADYKNSDISLNKLQDIMDASYIEASHAYREADEENKTEIGYLIGSILGFRTVTKSFLIESANLDYYISQFKEYSE